ncbi:hypothetical protein ES332_A10G201400v1 [Gossypium tomentosum]|uniref:Uncharacterized protein n=1 Tax=Gossypium tomentosum TaxID=34277 RepID=A0A5D2NUF2_GOSTO|nr:hypothetical protein ES332_A10G201400v1 [Gossypium tomentosum]
MLSNPPFISSSFLQLGFQHPSSPAVHRAERRREWPRGRSWVLKSEFFGCGCYR